MFITKLIRISVIFLKYLLLYHGFQEPKDKGLVTKRSVLPFTNSKTVCHGSLKAPKPVIHRPGAVSVYVERHCSSLRGVFNCKIRTLD